VVQTLGFPYSISETFLQRNQRQTLEQSLEAFDSIVALAQNAGLDVVAYISMAFGNPYSEPWNIEEVINACDLLVDSGAQQISLADTVGIATPAQIAKTVAAVLAAHDSTETGVHLHARPSDAPSRIRAAYDAGCRRFDSAIGGLGGCPFAQDALVGNISTETLLKVLTECGAILPKIRPLDEIIRANAEIAAAASAPVQ
jgi:hydroxymethylglutaryl-CoA lyase